MTDPDPIAAAIHETWRALSRTQGWSMGPALDRPYADLADADKEDNRAAARRMGEVLAVASLGLTNDPVLPSPPDAMLKAMMEAAMERMAEAEHDGWMAQRARTGWSWGPARDDAGKRHPAMVPYAQLSERDREKDRSNIRHYPDFAARAGYRIVPLK